MILRVKGLMLDAADGEPFVEWPLTFAMILVGFVAGREYEGRTSTHSARRLLGTVGLTALLGGFLGSLVAHLHRAGLLHIPNLIDAAIGSISAITLSASYAASYLRGTNQQCQQMPHSHERQLAVDNQVELSTLDWTEWNDVAPLWETLWRQSPSRSPFMCAAWVEAWFATFGSQLRPVIAVASHRGSPVGCCLLTRRVEWQHGMPLRRVYLNTAGEDASDDVCVEYNDLLTPHEFKSSFISALVSRVKHSYVDEFIVSGIYAPDTLSHLRSEWPTAEYQTRNAPYVDLTSIRQIDGGYEQQLSSNTRAQVRRSRKLLELESGPVQIEVARTVSEAHAFLGELAELHQALWTAKGMAGAFRSANFSSFHRLLIERLVPLRGIDLIRVRAGARTIGVLYNFISERKVYFYQSGFLKLTDNRLKPGLVSHVEAIKHYHSAGFGEYDFLAGDSQYKQSLKNCEREIQWVTFHNNTLRMQLIRHARSARSWARRFSSAPAPNAAAHDVF